MWHIDTGQWFNRADSVSAEVEGYELGEVDMGDILHRCVPLIVP